MLRFIINNLKEPTLLIIDFCHIDTLTYEFIEKSLKQIIETDKNNNLIILYKIDFEQNIKEIITGHVDFLELREQNIDGLDDNQLLNRDYSLVYIDDKHKIEFLGKLNDVEKCILDIISDKGTTTHIEIEDILRKKDKRNYCEEISNVVTRLKELGFIFHLPTEGETPSKYISIKYILENGSTGNKK
jgi:hypothetical protein